MEEIEKILNMKKIRYEFLDDLLKNIKKLYGKPGSTVNICIDVPNMIKQLYNPKNIELLSRTLNKNRYCITSCIINMVAHYRHYFASRWRCYTNIYFMINTLTDKNIIGHYDINYKKNYYEKRIDVTNEVFGTMNSVMKQNYNVIKIISDYLPHVYWIDSRSIDYRSQFPFIKNNIVQNGDLSIVITNDHIFYQSVLYDNTIILEPRGDKSRIVSKDNVIPILAGKSKTLEKNKDALYINPDNITLLDLMVNQKEYDIEGIRKFGYTKALLFLYKNKIDIGRPILNESSIESIFDGILEENEIKTLNKNLNIFSNEILYQRNEKKLDLIFENADNFINDPFELRKVNEKYFEGFPLILDFIFEGENTD